MGISTKWSLRARGSLICSPVDTHQFVMISSQRDNRICLWSRPKLPCPALWLDLQPRRFANNDAPFTPAIQLHTRRVRWYHQQPFPSFYIFNGRERGWMCANFTAPRAFTHIQKQMGRIAAANMPLRLTFINCFNTRSFLSRRNTHAVF